ncbi:MAG: Bug family tripartite tricarboxylate transporter substrate binding protein [Burkholderiales bacterium]
MSMKKRTAARLAFCAPFALLPLAGINAQTYPVKPIRFIVPFSAGGGADIVARAVGQKLTETLKQQVIIDNRTGAAGIIGMEAAAKAPPDGYTIVLGQTGPNSINPSLYDKLPYDALKDFAPITETTRYPYILVVHPSVPARNVKELIALAKSHPNGLTFASAGNGAANHLAAELLKTMAQIRIVHVPYKASAPALIDVLGGHVSMMFDPVITCMPHVRVGKLRALAVTSLARSAIAPELPTIAETGLPGYEAIGWHGVLAPAATPKDIVAKLNAEIVRNLQTPDMRARFAEQGAEPVGNAPEEFARFLKEDLEKWSRVVKTAGVRATM